MGNLRSKFGKNRSTNYVTFLSTDAGRTDGWTDGRTDGRLRDFIVCPMHMHMHWTDNYVIGNILERQKRKKLMRQMTMAKAEQPVISSDSRSGRYPSSDGDIHRFDVPDEYVSFDVSMKALFMFAYTVL